MEPAVGVDDACGDVKVAVPFQNKHTIDVFGEYHDACVYRKAKLLVTFQHVEWSGNGATMTSEMGRARVGDSDDHRLCDLQMTLDEKEPIKWRTCPSTKPVLVICDDEAAVADGAEEEYAFEALEDVYEDDGKSGEVPIDEADLAEDAMLQKMELKKASKAVVAAAGKSSGVDVGPVVAVEATDIADSILDAHVAKELGGIDEPSAAAPPMAPVDAVIPAASVDSIAAAFREGIEALQMHLRAMAGFTHITPPAVPEGFKHNVSLVQCDTAAGTSVRFVNWKSIVSLHGQHLFLDGALRLKCSVFADFPNRDLVNVEFIIPDTGIYPMKWKRSTNPRPYVGGEILHLRTMWMFALESHCVAPDTVASTDANCFICEREVSGYTVTRCALCMRPYHTMCGERLRDACVNGGLRHVVAALTLPRWPGPFRGAQFCPACKWIVSCIQMDR